MKTLNIVVLFALISTAQVYGRPDKYDEGFIEDTPQEYDDDDDIDTVEKDNKDTSSGPPAILSKPINYDVEAGQTVEFPCERINADNIAATWKKDGTDLFIGTILVPQHKTNIKLRQNYSLIIENVTKADSSSNYVCEILSGGNSIKVIHSLRVDNDWMDRLIRPWPKKSIHINEGDSIKFGCETKFIPTKEMKWSLKGERPHFNEEINGNYITIKKATHKNHGHYQCLAEDGTDRLYDESVDITVNSSPIIELSHDTVHTGLGMNATLTCKVYGHPHVRVTWSKNGENYSDKKNKKFITESKSHEHKLIIKHVSQNDLGIYKCIATNSKGTVAGEIKLTGTPATPKFIANTINDDDSTFTLKWHVESFSPIIEYTLEYRKMNEEQWSLEKPKVIKNNVGYIYTAEYSFKNLEPNKYEAVLKAQNAFGWSERSSIHSFRKEILSEKPENVEGMNSNASTTQPLTVLAALFLVVVSFVTIRL